MAPAVEIRDLAKHFGDFHAVDGITFDVEEGEIFGFLGANGAGKSTTIRMLCGLLTPTSGRARVLGIDVAKDPDADGAVRVKAATEILNRTLGKPTETMELNVRTKFEEFGDAVVVWVDEDVIDVHAMEARTG